VMVADAVSIEDEFGPAHKVDKAALLFSGAYGAGASFGPSREDLARLAEARRRNRQNKEAR
jgi:hypothetical protein